MKGFVSQMNGSILPRTEIRMEYRRGGISISIESCNGVYEPSDDSILLADNVLPSGRILEVGCGTGLISILCRKMGHPVEAVDINPAAVECTLANAKRNGVELWAHVSDLFSSVTGKFDTVIFNPPYLPVEEEVPGFEQWAGGPDGFKVVRRFLTDLPRFMDKGGKCYIVLSDLADIDLFMSESRDFSFRTVASTKLFFERLLLMEVSIRVT
jgi:release factor glutamine methyltransferase